MLTFEWVPFTPSEQSESRGYPSTALRVNAPHHVNVHSWAHLVSRVARSLVIGGVTLSTLLTLFVVPCAYSLFTRLERKTYVLSAIRNLARGEV